MSSFSEQTHNSKKILILMNGSIAAYKVCHVISRLRQGGHDVQVVASPSALKFIGTATLEGLSGKPVASDTFSEGSMMDHIHLQRWADLILVAPATANFINKAANGVGDDLATTIFLAHDFKKPLLLAPAMNTQMYLHPATQSSLKKLKDMGVQVLETASGVLACGENGWGKLLEPDLILAEIQKCLPTFGGIAAANDTGVDKNFYASSPLAKPGTLKVLVTAGGTQEPIDAVRAITNTSTGKTGAKIAETLSAFGMNVTLAHAQSAPQASGARNLSFQTFSDLQTLMKNELQTGSYDVVVHAAAVSDYSVKAHDETKKLSSDAESLTLNLVKNPKLVNAVKALSPQTKLIAFKLTANASQEQRQEAVEKLVHASGADLVIQNDTSEINKSSGTHLFHAYEKLKKIQTAENSDQLLSFLSHWILSQTATITQKGQL